jgi:pimeloyl-ACP methyl ester carboxylesterase
MTVHEFRPRQPKQEVERAEVAVLGGALTVDACADLIYPGLLGDDSSLSRHDRFVANPSGQINDLDEIRLRVEDRVEKIASALDQRIVLVGHSLGGLEATDLGHRRPDIVAGVLNIAGLQDGMEEETWMTALIKIAAGNPGDADLLKPDSPFIEEHRTGIREAWSDNVSLTSVTATYDACFPRFRGLGLELPEGQEHDRFIAAPSWLPDAMVLKFAQAKGEHLPDNVTRLPTRHITEHGLIVKSGAVIRLAKEFRAAAVANGLAIGAPVANNSVELRSPVSQRAVA